MYRGNYRVDYSQKAKEDWLVVWAGNVDRLIKQAEESARAGVIDWQFAFSLQEFRGYVGNMALDMKGLPSGDSWEGALAGLMEDYPAACLRYAKMLHEYSIKKYLPKPKDGTHGR